MTTIELTSVLVTRDGLAVEPFDDALLIWDDRSAKLHHLDLLAALVWEELDGRRTLDQVAAELATEFSAPQARIAADILVVARQWFGEGLVTPPTSGGSGLPLQTQDPKLE